MSAFRAATHASIAAIALLVAGFVAAAERDPPGVFDYYVLVLGWSPTYCVIEGQDRRDRQCADGAALDFVLHGLWPQFDKGWPEDCYAGKRPWIPHHVIEAMRDIMPSTGLIIHEYKAHGTCSGLTPEQYYATARTLYDRVRVPTAFDDPETQRFLSPAQIESEFIAANPWLTPDMIAITCRRANLLDIRVCFDRDLRPRACGVNEEQRRLCPAGKITVPVP